MKCEDTLSSYQFHQIFPDETAAVEWAESIRWPDGVSCVHCGSGDVAEVKSRKPMPYRCRSCRKHFSVKVGSLMQDSKLSVRQWLYAMYLMSVSKKGLSSMQLGRELGIAQEAAWRLGHKIRQAWNQGSLFPMSGEVEVDETYIGGKERNKHAWKREHLGRGPVGKQAVMGIRSRGTGEVRAFPVERTDVPRCRQAYAPTSRQALISSRTRIPPTWGCTTMTTRPSLTAQASTCAAWHTPTGLSPSGRCLSVVSSARTTR